MILGKFTKQPVEVLDFDIDFSLFLKDGDVLVTEGDPPVPVPLVLSVEPTGLVLGNTFVKGNVLKQWVSGGVNGERYKITITVTTSSGRVEQVEFIVRVKDE